MQDNRVASSLYDITRRDKAILLFESAEEDEWHISEMRNLALSADVEIAGEFFSRAKRRYGQSFISSDRLLELAEVVQQTDANAIIVAHDLTPDEHTQVSEVSPVRVIDRTQLILDIFAGRAHTREGKLQVELAQLSYLLPRLTGFGSQLSRLGGGVGTRGPGETKLETDRRRLRKKIETLSSEIDTIRKHREIARSARQKLPFPTAALVGYTSAGKSTLLNALSGSDVVADSKLFSTLDPTTRRVVLPNGWGILLTDTVGFIRDLPHLLVAAFRATLEEVSAADILVHVVDASHPNMDKQIQSVKDTLEEIGVFNKPIVTVYNKADRCADTYRLRELIAGEPLACYISAIKREGLQHLISVIEQAVSSLLEHIEAIIPYDRSDLVSACYDFGHVIRADYQEDGIHLVADIASSFSGNLYPYTSAGRRERGDFA